MDILSNNLANSSTAGFKQDRLLFDDLISRDIQTDFEQGGIHQTERPLDVAIFGDAFFKIKTAQGIRLTRCGQFHLTSTGALVTPEGDAVLGTGNTPIQLNPDGGEPIIDAKGRISQRGQTVGTLDIVQVDDKRSLAKEKGTRFVGTDGNEPQSKPATDYGLEQGHVEMSNVDLVPNMVHMISNFRAYESYMKIVQSMYEMDVKSASQVGRVA